MNKDIAPPRITLMVNGHCAVSNEEVPTSLILPGPELKRELRGYGMLDKLETLMKEHGIENELDSKRPLSAHFMAFLKKFLMPQYFPQYDAIDFPRSASYHAAQKLNDNYIEAADRLVKAAHNSGGKAQQGELFSMPTANNE